MPSQEEIDYQQDLLTSHRRTLATLLKQRAQLTSAYAPPGQESGIREARDAIAHCKATLRGWSVTVDDRPDDTEEVAAHRNQGGQATQISRVELRRLHAQALAAYYSQEWEQVETLLEQVVFAAPDDIEAQKMLAEARNHLDVQARYQAIRALRDRGLWQAVLKALDALEHHQPGAPDLDGLRVWAEESSRQARIGDVRSQITTGNFAQALDALDNLVRLKSADHEVVNLVATLIESPNVPFDQRLRAADIAGRVGDPRIPVEMEQWRSELARRNEDFGNPHGYWCHIRANTYYIGGWKEGETSADIQLPTFWIARYPITVAQFASFVKVGYDEKAEDWWTPDGWKWRVGVQHTQPRGWNTLAYDSSNLPVFGITWYEALAFTEWLTIQLGDTLPPDYVIRLPTEAEWEVAAAYDENERCLYPWGKQTPDPERAIYDASKLGRPAPVGCCPTGAAACGALDMCGNVWEATVSDYRGYPARSGERVDNNTSDDYEVSWRGGAWWGDKTLVWCGARDGLRPNSGFGISVGFRVVLALPQSLGAVHKLSATMERS